MVLLPARRDHVVRRRPARPGERRQVLNEGVVASYETRTATLCVQHNAGKEAVTINRSTMLATINELTRSCKAHYAKTRRKTLNNMKSV